MEIMIGFPFVSQAVKETCLLSAEAALIASNFEKFPSKKNSKPNALMTKIDNPPLDMNYKTM